MARVVSQPFTPRAYQSAAVRYLLETPRCALWAGMGLGKTVATLTALDALRLAGGGPALVVAPLRVAQSVWPVEATKWDHLSDLRVVSVVGNAAARRRALATPADVYVINYENFIWLANELCGQWPFETIVADESTRLKGFRLRQGTKRSRMLGKVAWRSDRFIELTGTPAPNGLIDLWGQAWFLDRGERLGATYTAFTDRWFRDVSKGQFPVIRPMPHAQSEIQAALADRCLTIDPRDHFDLREPIHIVVKVEMPESAREAYEQLAKEMYAEIDGQDVEAFSAAALTMKSLQCANGAIYTGPGNADWVVAHDVKLETLSEIVADAAGAPVLVAYQFRSDLARLMAAFPVARELDKEPETIAAWNEGRIPILIAHPASAGHGLNLQDGGNILVFFGHWWDLEQRQQIIERIGPVRQAQAGHDRPVYVYDLVASDTIDELVLRRHQTKASVQDLLLAAMKGVAC